LESTRAKWCDLFPQFDEACKMCKQIQYYILIKGGLNNTFNSNIVKMLGSHYFGISETLKIGSVDWGTTEEEMERINKFLSSNQQRNDEPNEVV
jgi:hypothetical protein